MKLTKQQREVRQIELVETYNLSLSLQRISDSGSYDRLKWRRALYHAISMSGVSIETDNLKQIREALTLP